MRYIREFCGKRYIDDATLREMVYVWKLSVRNEIEDTKGAHAVIQLRSNFLSSALAFSILAIICQLKLRAMFQGAEVVTGAET
jgi:hypothetical protein